MKDTKKDYMFKYQKNQQQENIENVNKHIKKTHALTGHRIKKIENTATKTTSTIVSPIFLQTKIEKGPAAGLTITSQHTETNKKNMRRRGIGLTQIENTTQIQNTTIVQIGFFVFQHK